MFNKLANDECERKDAVRTLLYRCKPHVAQVLFHAGVSYVSVATEHLQALVADGHTRIRQYGFEDRNDQIE